jgi:tetrahydromethanopterin S-methyltransferase subunit G
MGFIEERRQPFQDFSYPETRAINARLDAIEKKIASLDAKTDQVQPQVVDAPHRSELYTLVMERLARLESKLQNVA